MENSELTLEQKRALALASARLRVQQSSQKNPVDALPPAQASFGPSPITPGQQRNRDVAGNAAKEAVAGFADMFGNAPTNAYNLGKAVVGTGAAAMGRPDMAPEMTTPPDIMRNTFLKQGWINPQDAPQDTGEKYLSAATQGATAGAPGGIPGMALGAAGNVNGQTKVLVIFVAN